MISPPGGGDSAWLLKNLDAFDLRKAGSGPLQRRPARPAVGTRRGSASGRARPLREEPRRDRRGVEEGASATLIFATTTPIDDERHAKRGGGYDRFEKDVRRYNEAALKVMAKHGVIVHDLAFPGDARRREQLLDSDGTHYTPGGQAVAWRTRWPIASCGIWRSVLRRGPERPRSRPRSGRDVSGSRGPPTTTSCPPRTRSVPAPEFAVPATRRGVEETPARRAGRRPSHRSATCRPGRKPGASWSAAEIHPAFLLESLTIPNGIDGEMSAMLLLPHERARRPLPAILWLHSSSYDHNQLLTPGYNGGEEPLGEVCEARAMRCFAPDAAGTAGGPARGPPGRRDGPRSSRRRC